MKDKADFDADNSRLKAKKATELDEVWDKANKNGKELLKRDELPNLLDSYNESKTARNVPNEAWTDEIKKIWYDFFED